MATLISCATGNFTSSSTWKVASAVASAELDSDANSVTILSSNSDSGTFVLAATNVDAVAIKILSIVTPTGTITIKLRNSTTSTDVATVTINASDLNASAAGWHVFSFAPHTPNGTDSYLIRTTRSVADSSSNRITIYASTASVTNISRLVRLVTTATPASGDKLTVVGEFTGAGTSTSYTVTMNETATTSYGPTVSGGPPQGITISDKATLTYGTSASTNYYLKYKGVLVVYAGGIFNIGTSGTNMPSTSSAVLEMDSVANVDTGLDIKPGGTFNAYGNIKWPTSAITGATNATPIEITSTSHGLVAGVRIIVASVVGNTAANGTWEVIASTGANTFTIGSINGAVGGGPGNTTGNGSYTSGGTWQRLPYTMLSANASAAATALTLLSTSGWANSDELCFASTTRTTTECEKKTITTVDSATGVTLSAGLTNAHSGTSPTQAEVGNLTRNVKIRGISTSLQGYLLFETTSTVVCQNVEFYQLGSANTSKRGIDIQTTTGSCVLSYCSMHDFIVASSTGSLCTGGVHNNFTLSANVFYNMGVTAVIINVTTGTNWTLDGNLCVLSLGVGVSLSDAGGTFTNNTIVGAGSTGLNISDATTAMGTLRGNTIHSTAFAVNFGSGASGTFSNSSVWRNNGRGITSASSTSAITIDTATLFGNLTSSIQPGTGGGWLFKNVVSSGDSTFATTSGYETVANQAITDFFFENCTFGVASGIKVAHTQDVICTASYLQITLRNCLMASATEVSSQSSLIAGSYIRSQKHDQTAGSHKTWLPYGTISIDTTIYDTSPSARLTPNNASSKLELWQPFRVPIASGQTVTVSVKVRKSASGDGATYNGSQPRLILKKNISAGISSDTVLATATNAANGAFETISGTTSAVTDDGVLEFLVDCDGTVGWVNVDTWTSNLDRTIDSRRLKTWINGESFAVSGVGTGGKGIRTGGRL